MTIGKPETCKDFGFLEFCVFPTNLQGSCIYWKSPTQASPFTGGGEKVHLWRGGGGGPGGGGHQVCIFLVSINLST